MTATFLGVVLDHPRSRLAPDEGVDTEGADTELGSERLPDAVLGLVASERLDGIDIGHDVLAIHDGLSFT